MPSSAKAGAGDVFVNSAFHRADLRIATELVEPLHGRALGRAQGRLPGARGQANDREVPTAPAFLESPFAQNLILKGNPCHEESLAIARTVGVDFIVNATSDRDMHLTVDVMAAHEAAGALIRDYVSVPVEHEYDIVLTHGGYISRYQAVKAAHNALPAIREGGILIVVTDNRDSEADRRTGIQEPPPYAG